MDRSHATVFVVDDDPAVLDSMVSLFTSVGLATRTFADAKSFLADPSIEGPGCLVLDVRLPDLSGLELQDALKARHIALPVILITGNADVPMAVRGMLAGAIDFLEKPFSSHLLLERVEQALRRDEEDRVKRQGLARARALIGALTSRESSVVRMVTDGLANKEMARLLGITQKTVELHRAKAMRKLGATHVAQLVALELRARAS